MILMSQPPRDRTPVRGRRRRVEVTVVARITTQLSIRDGSRAEFLETSAGSGRLFTFTGEGAVVRFDQRSLRCSDA